MKIISRAEAKALGLQYYYTGIPCKHGHDSERYSTSGGCKACHSEQSRKWYAVPPEKSRKRRRSLRDEAVAHGHQHYNTEVPCRNGHNSPRFAASGECVACSRASNRRAQGRFPLRNTWHMMIHRCTNEENGAYHNYGGRGIAVCDRWLDPENGYDNFVADMGPRPEGFTLDRIDYNGNYEPSNCRWADGVTQARNTRWSKLDSDDVISVFQMLDAGAKHREIAVQFGCTVSNIRAIKSNREFYIARGLDCRQKAA